MGSLLGGLGRAAPAANGFSQVSLGRGAFRFEGSRIERFEILTVGYSGVDGRCLKAVGAGGFVVGWALGS